MAESSKRTATVLVVALFALPLPASHAQLVADGHETHPSVFIDQILPAKMKRSGNHQVLNEIAIKDNALHFRIESDYGAYKVASLPMVSVRVHEIRTLAQAIDHFNRSNRKLAKELRGQLAIGADSFVEILTSPLSTTTSLVDQFTDNVGQTFTELGELSDPDSRPESSDVPNIYERLMPSDPVAARHKRNVASQLGLDVYSSNRQVQEFLNTLARARSSGNRNAGMVTISLPRNPGPRVAGGRIDTRVRTALTRQTINELYRHNESRLSDMGITDALVHAFLGHKRLSPRHKTSITEHLVFLEDVGNRSALIEAAIGARTEEDALAYEQMARTLAVYHEQHTPLRELKSGGHVLLAVTATGSLITILPFDIVYWNRDTDTTFSALAKYARDKGFVEREVIVNGIFTKMARTQMERRGFNVRELFLLRP